jgi:hypothetical protein
LGNASNFGHAVISQFLLFTFNIKDSRIKELQELRTGYRNRKRHKLTSTGPLLITLGNERPSNLKLSAWGHAFCMTKLSVYHFRKLVE